MKKLSDIISESADPYQDFLDAIAKIEVDVKVGKTRDRIKLKTEGQSVKVVNPNRGGVYYNITTPEEAKALIEAFTQAVNEYVDEYRKSRLALKVNMKFAEKAEKRMKDSE